MTSMIDGKPAEESPVWVAFRAYFAYPQPGPSGFDAFAAFQHGIEAYESAKLASLPEDAVERVAQVVADSRGECLHDGHRHIARATLAVMPEPLARVLRDCEHLTKTYDELPEHQAGSFPTKWRYRHDAQAVLDAIIAIVRNHFADASNMVSCESPGCTNRAVAGPLGGLYCGIHHGGRSEIPLVCECECNSMIVSMKTYPPGQKVVCTKCGGEIQIKVKLKAGATLDDVERPE